ncbi:MAG: putative glycosyltransferase [Algoriphagus marincola HL-49]|uniref:Putative glycosyltransferase n=1 Tax=Algoriphagus marincola HL-49 TaxID=1305737 RepID=A0A0N8KF59_9BACT|nr:MAG: putative glycosyltransferase [Algoriphagus marincola HL-49]
MSPIISVIIPVYKDWIRLQNCLQALQNQSADHDCFEVIVVNNEPNFSPAPLSHFDFRIKVLNQTKPGSYAARNKGLEAVQGKAVMFTDSDCEPDHYWIKRAIELIQKDEFELFAGRIDVVSKIENIWVRYDQAFAFPNESYVHEENFGVTANLLVKAKVFDQVGGFKDSMFTGGDSEFCNRAVKAGFRISYDQSLIVKHPARESWNSLRTKAIRFGGRLPQGKSRLIIWLKLLGKFRIRFSDHSKIWGLSGVSLIDKTAFSHIKQRLRWVEAWESMQVFFGKSAGRK